MSALRKKAFTLLETLLALAILGISLLSILQINAQAVNSHIYAKRLTIATLLARSKMIDLEQQMHDKGLSVDDDEESGDFSDEGWSSYKWRAKIIAPKTNGLTPDQLLGAIFNLPIGGGKEGSSTLLDSLFGAGGKTPAPGGAAAGALGAAAGALPGAAGGGAAGALGALGPVGAMFQQQMTTMIDQIQKSVREVHLTVTWREGKMTESFDLVTHVVSLGPGSDRNGGAAAAAGAPTGGAADQWVRSDNGQPVPNPQPAPNGAGMVDPRDGAVLMTAAQWQARNGGAAGAAGVPQLNPLNMGTIQKGNGLNLFR